MRLRSLAADIEGLHRTHFSELVDRLTSEAGLIQSDIGGAVQVKMAGIRAQSTAGLHGAVTNWANAARRKLLELEG